MAYIKRLFLGKPFDIEPSRLCRGGFF